MCDFRLPPRYRWYSLYWMLHFVLLFTFLFHFCWHVYVLWLGVSQWKLSPTVKGSRCQGHSLTEIKTFLSIKVLRHNAITPCASGNAWADVSRSSIRFTSSSVARHVGPCICHNSQTYTSNDVIPYKGRTIRVFFSFTPATPFLHLALTL